MAEVGLPASGAAGELVAPWREPLRAGRDALPETELGDDLGPDAPPVTDELRGIGFTSSVTETEPPAGAADDPSWRLVNLKARGSSQLWGGLVTEELELLGFGVRDDADPASGGTAPRLLWFGVKGSWGWVESGIRVQSVTTGLERITGPKVKADREGVETWLGLRLDRVRLRLWAGEFRDNVADDLRKPWTNTTEIGTSVALALPSGSVMSLGVSHGSSERTAAARGAGLAAGLADTEYDSLVATLYKYGGPAWDTTLSSTYTWSADVGRPEAETASVAHDLSGSYRVTPAVTLWPTLSVSSSTPEGAGVSSQSLTASLSMALAPLVDAFDLSLYGGYTRSRIGDGSFDGRSLDASASLVWNLRRAPPKTTLSFQIGHHRYADAASPTYRYEESVGLLILRVESF